MLKESLIIQTFSLIRKVITAKQKRNGLLALAFSFLNSITDLIGLATLIPLLMVIIDEGKIHSNKFLRSIFDFFGFTSNQSFVLFLCAAVLGLIILKNLLSLFLISYQTKYSFGLYKYFSSRLYVYYYSQGLLYIKNHNSNALVNNIGFNVSMFVQNVIMGILGVINESLIILLVLIAILIYNPLAILILLASVFPVVVIFSRLVRSKLANLGREMSGLNVKMNKTILESLHGYTDFEIKNKTDWAYKRLVNYLDEMSNRQVKKFVLLQVPAKIIEVAIVVCLIVIILVSLLLKADLSNLSVLMGVFGIAAYRILPSLNKLMVYMMNIRNNQFIFEIIDKTRSKTFRNSSDQHTLNRMEFDEEIELKEVTFSFPGSSHRILDQFSFVIRKGERIGVIGKSGSGKSTLINILLRFYEQDSGHIFVDGRELTRKNNRQWRNIIGYVPQDVFVMDATLAENIAFGEALEDIDFVKLKEVINLSMLEPLVASLSKGVRTSIGERGGKLSGGQKQRLGIARALYNNAEVLFFDEATSALDNETEEEINNSILHLSKIKTDLTIVIIAHRISSLKHCSRIIELDEGKIVREQKYADLL